jgi:hypothetical protein
MTEPEDQPTEYGLVMPFVNVTSRGGSYDDDAYCAGWEMGRLEADLERTRSHGLHLTIHTGNVAQADLLAMKHGYRAEITETDVVGWSYLRLTRADGS